VTEIIPAILPKSYAELQDKLDIVAGHTPVVQIDICDGMYVSNRTWPYLKGTDADGRAADQIFEEITSQEKALPHWDEIDFEFDLMVRGAFEKIPDFISAGASRIVVHRASVDDAELASIIRDFGKHSEELGPFDVELGLALMPGGASGADSPEDIARTIAIVAPNIHFIQVMGIAKIGYQGQLHDPRSIELVKALKTLYPALPVAVDGAVDIDTARAFIDAGADRLVVGSALFGTDDFLGTLERFQALS
jgi:ribulose-phosphate 3-epimerase